VKRVVGASGGREGRGDDAGVEGEREACADEGAIAAYRGLLRRFHRTLDLMSPRAFADLDRFLGEAERYARAVVDLAPHAGVVLDLGTGAGLPGVVVAARLPGRELWWVERRRRRAAFLTQVAAEAGLTSVRVVADDVRMVAPPPSGVAAVTAQAVGTLTEVAKATRHLWGPRVLLVSRRGPDWDDEVAALTAWWRRFARPGAAGQADAVGNTTDAYADQAVARGQLADPRVLRAEPLGTRGTLVAVELHGG
jgi:16S rRNA (guanine527-N7)-methyltransferase